MRRFPFKRCGEEAMSSGLRMNKEKWRAVAGHIAPLPQVLGLTTTGIAQYPPISASFCLGSR